MEIFVVNSQSIYFHNYGYNSSYERYILILWLCQITRTIYTQIVYALRRLIDISSQNGGKKSRKIDTFKGNLSCNPAIRISETFKTRVTMKSVVY